MNRVKAKLMLPEIERTFEILRGYGMKDDEIARKYFGMAYDEIGLNLKIRKIRKLFEIRKEINFITEDEAKKSNRMYLVFDKDNQELSFAGSNYINQENGDVLDREDLIFWLSDEDGNASYESLTVANKDELTAIVKDLEAEGKIITFIESLYEARADGILDTDILEVTRLEVVK